MQQDDCTVPPHESVLSFFEEPVALPYSRAYSDITKKPLTRYIAYRVYNDEKALFTGKHALITSLLQEKGVEGTREYLDEVLNSVKTKFMDEAGVHPSSQQIKENIQKRRLPPMISAFFALLETLYTEAGMECLLHKDNADDLMSEWNNVMETEVPCASRDVRVRDLVSRRAFKELAAVWPSASGSFHSLQPLFDDDEKGNVAIKSMLPLNAITRLRCVLPAPVLTAIEEKSASILRKCGNGQREELAQMLDPAEMTKIGQDVLSGLNPSDLCTIDPSKLSSVLQDMLVLQQLQKSQ
eukprot:6202931-Pleurochrysis_carterae.AAC.2